MGDSKLTDERREEAQRSRREMESALAFSGPDQDRARAVLLTRMLMAYPSAAASEQMMDARGSAYRDALDDVPAWAIAEAIRRWNRGECGQMNYNFAPAPAVLRDAALNILEPWRSALRHIDTALSAVTFERAMDSAPIKQNNPAIAKLRRA